MLKIFQRSLFFNKSFEPQEPCGIVYPPFTLICNIMTIPEISL